MVTVGNNNVIIKHGTMRYFENSVMPAFHFTKRWPLTGIKILHKSLANDNYFFVLLLFFSLFPVTFVPLPFEHYNNNNKKRTKYF